ncbi:MAG: Aldehyde Dehydrogenase [Actinomycetia bacterium]|nr:Aldehyde Dehydrogenase [Actinomycetes bacterium]
MIVKDKFFIDGQWVDPAGSGRIEVIEAATEEVLGTAPDGSTGDIDRAVDAARKAFDGPWSKTTAPERSELMTKLSGILQGKATDLASLITQETGSPVSWSIMGQVYAATMVLDYYANLAKTFEFEEDRQGALGSIIVRKEPVGVVGGIVPWNVPLFVTMLKLAPALASGCTMILKPSPETALDSYILAEALEEAGIPNGVVNIVPAGREVGEHLVTHAGVDKISFTGSTAAGKRIAGLCGERLRRCTLELGGKSAAIVLDDADLSTIGDNLLMGGSFMNNGQACVAQTRVLASRAKYDEVVEALVERARTIRTGDPLDAATELGPLVAKRQQDRVLGYIQKGQEEGAKVAIGGGVPSDLAKGWFIEPTVFVNVDNDMTIAREEIFGPVVSVIAYDDVEDAIRIANDSDYGLSGSVWTTDGNAGLEVARRVRTGTFGINGMGMDFGGPFGGFKNSGIGRELGPEGLAGYLESKNISKNGISVGA